MTDQPKPGDKPRINEFRLARQLTRRSQAEVATALGVSRQTISRYESGERDAPSDVVEWLQINRNQYASNVRPLCPKGGVRGEDMRPVRDAFLLPQTLLAAKAAEKA